MKVKRVLFLCGLSLILCFIIYSSVYALPQNVEVVEGEAEITYPNGHTMQIDADANTILNYESFNIGEGESVIVNLPDVNAALLNRVLGKEYSSLLGDLSCNGLFILVNESGIFVGPNANLRAASMILSTRDINNQDFLDGNYIFKRLSEKELDLLLLNEGNIHVSANGFCALIAGAIENKGNIIAKAGMIALAAGDAVKFELGHEGLISVAIAEPVARQIKDFAGEDVVDQIKNSGTLEAKRIILSAESLTGIFEKSINLEGYVKATSFEDNGGTISIKANGDVRVAADIEAVTLEIVSKGKITFIEPPLSELPEPKVKIEELKLNAPQLDIQTNAPTLIIEKTTDLYITAATEEDNYISLETAQEDRVMYLKSADLTLEAPNIQAEEAVLIQAYSLKLVSDRIGTYLNPVRVSASNIHIQSLASDIAIMESLGIGTSIRLRGPPTTGTLFFEYNRDTNLTIEARRVYLTGTDPIYLYGNITFHNFECTIPFKEIYFEPGKVYVFEGITNINIPDAVNASVFLRSHVEGEAYYMDVKSKNYTFRKVVVQDAHNLNPELIYASPSNNWGNNIGFDFNTVYWAGTGNWSTPSNWNTGVIPGVLDDVVFDGTSTGNSTIDTPFTIAALAISNLYTGTITVQAYTVITGNLAINGGTLNGGAALTVQGGSVTGNGTINFTGGTFTLEGTGNFGGTTGWTFFNLDFGDGSTAAVTSKTGPNTITVLNQLNVKTNHRLEAGTNTWTLDWAPATAVLTDISQIAAGVYHTLALKSDGSRVYAWGNNLYGGLGNNTTVHSFMPVEVLTGEQGDSSGYLTGISQISAGNYYSAALSTDGNTVYAWGLNSSGQLGNGSTTNSPTPVKVRDVGGAAGSTLSGISQISAGMRHVLALKSDSSRVYAWGKNFAGALGNNTTTDSTSPIEVLGVGGVGYLTDISMVSAGGNHSAALKSDGSVVYAWGYNNTGQLGDNTTIDKLTPVIVHGVGNIGMLTDISYIAAGIRTTFAVKSDGTRLYGWGHNLRGSIGDGTTGTRMVPVEVLGVGGTGYLAGIVKVYPGDESTFALASDGSVYAWGLNTAGRLGAGSLLIQNTTPVQVLKGEQAVAGDYLANIGMLAVSQYHSITLKADQSEVYAWGSNNYGQLGTNTTNSASEPKIVLGIEIFSTSLLSDISQIVAGGDHAMALKSDGSKIYTWGQNFSGQLGNGTNIDSFTPIEVLGVGGVDFLSDIGYIEACDASSFAIKKDGSVVYVWGNNAYGQLGDGTTAHKNLPVMVAGGEQGGIYLTNISMITSSGSHTLALEGDFTDFSLDGTPEQADLSRLPGVKVYAWGRNNYGQLGDGTLNDASAPVVVHAGEQDPGDPDEALTDIADISCAQFHSLALKRDGSEVYAWGGNLFGVLGNAQSTGNFVDPIITETRPVKVVSGAQGGGTYLTDITQIGAGLVVSVALEGDFSDVIRMPDGSLMRNGQEIHLSDINGTAVYTWGWAVYGLLGNGYSSSNQADTTHSNVPVKVLGGEQGGAYLTDISSIDVGYLHVMAIASDGTVLGWGYDYYNQLGAGHNGGFFHQFDSTPVYAVTGAQSDPSGRLTSISQISGGTDYTVALRNDGERVYSWGLNSHGQLGTKERIGSNEPVEVEQLIFTPLKVEGVVDYQESTFEYSGNFAGGSISIAGGDYYSLRVNSVNETLILAGDVTVQNIEILAGSLDVSASNYTIIVYGDWTNYGTFVPHFGEVIFDGGDQTIYGSNIFYDFTRLHASALYFQAGSTQTINGTLTLHGAPGDLLQLRSTAEGVQWYIDPQGGRECSYLDIRDSYNISERYIDPRHSFSSGNNNFWFSPAGNLPEEQDLKEDSGEPKKSKILAEGKVVNTESAKTPEAKYEKNYPSGKYKTIVILYEGEVIMAPYDATGPAIDQADIITGSGINAHEIAIP